MDKGVMAFLRYENSTESAASSTEWFVVMLTVVASQTL